MFFFFFCGERTFRKEIPGYEGMVCQCHHCGNMAGHVIKSHPWFTVCFIVSIQCPCLLSFPRPCRRRLFAPARFAMAWPASYLNQTKRLTPTAPDPLYYQGTQGCVLSHLQLQPATREPSRRHGHGQWRPASATATTTSRAAPAIRLATRALDGVLPVVWPCPRLLGVSWASHLHTRVHKCVFALYVQYPAACDCVTCPSSVAPRSSSFGTLPIGAFGNRETRVDLVGLHA